ncbi:hypothetical protein E5288_WYG008456 [Bos mutus]|uniref:Uncharacterized protein n=1 Tax=Bos mutus TaxID=72004 RepID=A0A6B0S1D0_9CETA|nr:hypothetical protein [Bos mutus]
MYTAASGAFLRHTDYVVSSFMVSADPEVQCSSPPVYQQPSSSGHLSLQETPPVLKCRMPGIGKPLPLLSNRQPTWSSPRCSPKTGTMSECGTVPSTASPILGRCKGQNSGISSL